MNLEVEPVARPIIFAETRRRSIERCIQTLVHACGCQDTNCSLVTCQRMKRVVQHTRVCALRVNGNCPTCKQLIALCFYHARNCQERNCGVPICSSIKERMVIERQFQRRARRLQRKPRLRSAAI